MSKARLTPVQMTLAEIRELPLRKLVEIPLPVWSLAAAITSCPSALQSGIYRMLERQSRIS